MIKRCLKLTILVLLVLIFLSCATEGDNLRDYCIPVFKIDNIEEKNNTYLSLKIDLVDKIKLSILETYDNLKLIGYYYQSVYYKNNHEWYYTTDIKNKFSIPYFNLDVNKPNSDETSIHNNLTKYSFMLKKDIERIKTSDGFFYNNEIICNGTKFNTATVIPIYNKILEYYKLSDYSEYYKANKEQINFSDIEKYDKELYDQYNHRIDEEKKKLGYDIPVIQNYIKKYSNNYNLLNKDVMLWWGWKKGIVTDFDNADDEKFQSYIFLPKSELIFDFYISNNPYGYDNNKIYCNNVFDINIKIEPLQFLNENSALFLLKYNNSYDSMIFYMSEPNLAKRLNEINYFLYDGVYKYTTTNGSTNIVPKFKEYKFPSINDEYKKEVKERKSQIKELEERITKEFESIIEIKLQEIEQQQEKLLAEINEMIKNYNETGSVEGTNNK